MAPCFPPSAFCSPKPLLVFSFLSLASVFLQPVPRVSPSRAKTTPVLVTAMSLEHVVGTQQMARMCTLAAQRDAAMGGKGSVGRGWSPELEPFRQWAGKVTWLSRLQPPVMGMLLWRQTTWEERVAPDGEAMRGAGGRHAAACPEGFPSPFGERAAAGTISSPHLHPPAWESQQEPLRGCIYFYI